MALGPGGKEVGRVSVRVVPDTSNFRKEAQAELEKATEGLEIEIPVQLDTAGLRQKLQAAVAQAERGVNANVGVDVDNIQGQIAGAIRRGSGDASVTPDVQFDPAQIRRASDQLNNGLQRGTGRGMRGRGFVGRLFSGIVDNIRTIVEQSGVLIRQLEDNIRGLRDSADALGESLEGAVRPVRELGNNDGTRDLADNIRAASDATDDLESSTRGFAGRLEDEFVDLDAVIDDFRRNVSEETDIVVGPSLDESAMDRFRRDFRRAMDRMSQDIDRNLIAVAAGDDDVDLISRTEFALRRVAEQSRVLRDNLRNVARDFDQLTNGTASLRYAWDGLVSTVRGVPGWLTRIRDGINNNVGSWDRFHQSIIRSSLALDDVIRRVQTFGNNANTNFGTALARGFIEFERAAQTAFTRVDQGLNRLGTGFNRINLETENVSRRLVDGWRSAGDALDNFGTRLYDVESRIRTGFGDIFLDVRGSILRAVDSLTDFDNHSNNIRTRWMDLQNQFDLVTTGIGNGVDRLMDWDRNSQTIHNTWTRIRDAVTGIDFNRGRDGIIGIGDDMEDVGRRGNLVTRGIGDAFQALGVLGREAFQGVGEIASTAASAVGSAFTSVGSQIGQVFSDLPKIFAGIGGPIGQIIMAVVQLVAALALIVTVLGAIAGILTIVGAAVTALWASVSVLIAGIPAAILLLGLPIAAIVAGLDGIKVAAERIAPQFEAMQAQVAKAFENGLTPVFQKFADELLPSVGDGLTLIADSLVGVAQSIVDMATSEQNIQNLDATFRNVAGAVDGLKAPLTDVVQLLLEAGAQKAAFDAITGFLTEFVNQWRQAVDSLNFDGTLQRAFEGLQTVLEAVARAFAGLVENGIRVFAAAAPGLTASLDSLTQFFGRFDWDRLGVAVGKVFEGLGQTLDKVPPETIERITQAFEDLGDVFMDPAIQQMFVNMIALIPTVIGWFDFLIGAFARVGSALSGLLQIFSGVFSGISETMQGFISNPFDIAGVFTEAFAKAAIEVDAGKKALSDAMASTGPDARSALVGGLTPLPGEAAGAIAPLPGLVGQSLAPLPGEIQEQLKTLPELTRTGMADMVTQAQTGFDNMALTITAEGANLVPLLQTALGGLGEAVNIAFENVNVQLSQRMAGLVTAMATGIPPVVAEYKRQLDMMKVQTDQSFILVSEAFAAGFATLVAAVDTGMATVLTAIETQFGGSTLAVETAMGSMVSIVQTNLDTILLAFSSVGDFQMPFILALQGMALGAQTEMVNIVVAVTAGLDNVRAVVVEKMLSIGDVFINSSMADIAIMNTNYGLMKDYVITKLEELRVAIEAKLAEISILFDTFGQNLIDVYTIPYLTLYIEVWTQMFVDLNTVIATGIATATETLRVGMEDAIAMLEGQVPRFVAAGEAMGQGLADGLRAKQGEVEAAAAALAEAAAAATEAAAQVNSPSKVFTRIGEFFGAGLSDGMDNSLRDVRRSAAGLADGAIDAAAGLSSAFEFSDVPDDIKSLSGISGGDWSAEVNSDGFASVEDRVVDALSKWGITIDANGIAKLVNKSNTRRERRG